MNLPDRFEEVGALLGSVFLVGPPVSALVGAVYGLTLPLWLVPIVWSLPGLIVGIPLAMGRLPVTYHQVWVITLSGWLLAFAGWTALGLSIPASNPSLAGTVWVGAGVLGILVARTRPVSTIRGHLRHA